MPSRYFYGLSVKSNRVTGSPAQNFRDLVQSYLEGPQILPITREGYAALTNPAERLTAKDTTYLLACTYKTEESERARENARDCCNLLFLDLDEDKETGECPAAPFVGNHALLVQRLEGLNFAAYKTASSTPKKPRIRIVVEADGIRVNDYRDAVQTVGRMLRLKSVTKESLTVNQPMICPSVFSDQDSDMDHPLFAVRYDGRAFVTDDIQRTQDEERPSMRMAEEEDDDEDGLAYLRGPLAGFTLERAKEALDVLDPSMGYVQWLEVALALRHQFSDTEENAHRAYEAFDNWSSGGDNYKDSEDTLDKWHDIRPTPKGRMPVTIRTLIKRAAEAGWDIGEVKQECIESVIDWVAEEAKTFNDFTQVALRKLAAVPMLTCSEEEVVMSAIITGLKETRKETVTKKSLKDDFRKIMRNAERAAEKARKADQADAEEEVKGWAAGWCYCTLDEKFYRTSSHLSLTPEALNCKYSRKLLPTEEALEKAGKDVTEATLHTPLYTPKDYLLNHVKCRVVDGYEYDPANANLNYVKSFDGILRVNTYRRSYCTADHAKMGSAKAKWFEHLGNLIKEEEYRVTLTDYIAFCVQNPGQKIRWCPLIQGAEGAGKSVIYSILEAALGPSNVTVVDNDALRQQWNDWAIGSQVVVMPEIYVTGRAKVDVMTKLKSLLTDDVVTINQRQRTSRKERNRSNHLMFTNHDDALYIMAGGRRYFVLKSLLQTEEQVRALGEDYFDALFNEVQTNGGGFRAFFESWSVSSSFKPNGRAPKTKYLQEMVEDSADEETVMLRTLIAEGRHPLIQDDLVGSASLMLKMKENGVNVTAPRIAACLRGEKFVRTGGHNGTVIDDLREHLWVRLGRLPHENIPALARQRYQDKYTTEEEI